MSIIHRHLSSLVVFALLAAAGPAHAAGYLRSTMTVPNREAVLADGWTRAAVTAAALDERSNFCVGALVEITTDMRGVNITPSSYIQGDSSKTITLSSAMAGTPTLKMKVTWEGRQHVTSFSGPKFYATLRDMVGILSSGPPASSFTSSDWNAFAEAGGTWCRMGGDWASVEKGKKGQYDWSNWDATFRNITRRGMKALILLSYGNTLYGTADYRTPPAVSPIPNEQLTGFINFANAAVARYGTRDAIYEIWNEPQWSFLDNRLPDTFSVADYAIYTYKLWNGPQWSFNDIGVPNTFSVANYATFAKEVSAAMKAAHPAVKIAVGGGLGFNEEESAWGKQAGKAWNVGDFINTPGVFDHADFLSIHPYRRSYPETLTYSIQDLHALSALTVPIINSEWGYGRTMPAQRDSNGNLILDPNGNPIGQPWSWDIRESDTEITNPFDGTWEVKFPPTAQDGEVWQAAMVVREQLVAASIGFPISIYFNARDGYLHGSDPNDYYWGLWRDDGSAKPAHDAVNAMLGILGDCEYQSTEKLEDGKVWKMHFKRHTDNKEIVAVYALRTMDEGLFTCSVPTGAAAYDYLGQPITGATNLTLIRNPQYIVMP